MKSEDSSLDDEIARVSIGIELIMTQIREDADTLAFLRKKILESLNNDPEYARKEVFSEQIKTETQLINDFLDKMKQLTELRARYSELKKEQMSK